jgi:hypothetical protein
MSEKLIGMRVLGMLMLGALSASAGTISATVDPINALSSEEYFTDVTGTANANLGAADVKIASGVINNNSVAGWQLTVTSANNGNLVKDGYARTIPYTDIEWNYVSGTRGSGLTDPSAAGRQSVVSGSCEFNTATKAATTATVNYKFELRISWGADPALVAGIYSDTITMTLAIDS